MQGLGVRSFLSVSNEPLACQNDRSTWEVLLYRIFHSLITVLMGHVSLLAQQKWQM